MAHSIETTTNGVLKVTPADQQPDTWEKVINENAAKLDDVISNGTDTSALVPYTGATADVVLNRHAFKVNANTATQVQIDINGISASGNIQLHNNAFLRCSEDGTDANLMLLGANQDQRSVKLQMYNLDDGSNNITIDTSDGSVNAKRFNSTAFNVWEGGVSIYVPVTCNNNDLIGAKSINSYISTWAINEDGSCSFDSGSVSTNGIGVIDCIYVRPGAIYSDQGKFTTDGEGDVFISGDNHTGSPVLHVESVDGQSVDICDTNGNQLSGNAIDFSSTGYDVNGISCLYYDGYNWQIQDFTNAAIIATGGVNPVDPTGLYLSGQDFGNGTPGDPNYSASVTLVKVVIGTYDAQDWICNDPYSLGMSDNPVSWQLVNLQWLIQPNGDGGGFFTGLVDHAINSDYCKNAYYATNAGNATNADYAINAGNATNANTATTSSSAGTSAAITVPAATNISSSCTGLVSGTVYRTIIQNSANYKKVMIQVNNVICNMGMQVPFGLTFSQIPAISVTQDLNSGGQSVTQYGATTQVTIILSTPGHSGFVIVEGF